MARKKKQTQDIVETDVIKTEAVEVTTEVEVPEVVKEAPKVKTQKPKTKEPVKKQPTACVLYGKNCMEEDCEQYPFKTCGYRAKIA